MHPFKKMILSIQSDGAVPTIGLIYLTNNNLNGSFINMTVNVNGSEVVLSGSTFPVQPGQSVMGTYNVGAGTNSTISVLSNNAADTAVKLYVSTTVPFQDCKTTTGSVDFTGVNLSTAPTVNITLNPEGNTSCL